ncbi:hypothetical protein VCRA2126O85_250022 [Vibrio crassostreae]|nr:hypothetical protein VCRA2128O106_230022 [Vibrio crassostreae]CAK2775150.1 hypothetical protein VCRA2125O83_230022 [Vibrio crassostreae]CAK2775739.1 hypothetical protein VCRA2128O100_250022 [Vibrio crassostreae]CAK2780758.1 hypothetical protein VCRA2127O91_250022 [Vibrio crassostreae]CAK2785994.1 hypothetical protein VCRA2126O85_250022 [Vibrio crassostreae]
MQPPFSIMLLFAYSKAFDQEVKWQEKKRIYNSSSFQILNSKNCLRLLSKGSSYT